MQELRGEFATQGALLEKHIGSVRVFSQWKNRNAAVLQRLGLYLVKKEGWEQERYDVLVAAISKAYDEKYAFLSAQRQEKAEMEARPREALADNSNHQLSIGRQHDM